MTSSRPNSGKQIKNLAIQMDIDCHRRKLERKGIIPKLMNKKDIKVEVWDNFDIFKVSEALARSLKAGSFSHIKEFIIDGEYIFSTPSKSGCKSIKEAIKLFSQESELRKRFKIFEYEAVKFAEGKDVICKIWIKRQHYEGEPAIKMKIKGNLVLNNSRKILKNIERNLKVKHLKTDPAIEYW